MRLGEIPTDAVVGRLGVFQHFSHTLMIYNIIAFFITTHNGVVFSSQLPFYVVLAFGAYTAISILYSVYIFPSCPQAGPELERVS